jgi:hypothetical protein
MKRIGKFVIESDSLITRLRELDTVTAVKSFGKSGLKVFCELLCHDIMRGGFEFTERPVFLSTGIAGNNTFVCQIIWSDEIIAAALDATRDHLNTHISHAVDCRPPSLLTRESSI